MDILTLKDWRKTWTVLRIDPGDRLVSGRLNVTGSVIEFYDPDHKHTKFGQFVASYDTETLMAPRYGQGLDLAGDVDGWELSADAMVRVVKFITLTGGISSPSYGEI